MVRMLPLFAGMGNGMYLNIVQVDLVAETGTWIMAMISVFDLI